MARTAKRINSPEPKNNVIPFPSRNGFKGEYYLNYKPTGVVFAAKICPCQMGKEVMVVEMPNGDHHRVASADVELISEAEAIKMFNYGKA
jgi:hypothetical protein